MHRIHHRAGVEQHEGLVGRLDHVGGKAVAAVEIGAPCGTEAVVPAGIGGVERGLRANRHHPRARSRHRIGRRRIAAGMGAVKHHLVEILEEAVIGQPVEIAVDLRLAKPAFVLRHDGQARPAQPLDKAEAARGAVGVEAAGMLGRFEADQQGLAVIDEGGHVAGAQGLEIAVLVSDFLQPCRPGGGVEGCELGIEIHGSSFKMLGQPD